jgi:hypothetical protein
MSDETNIEAATKKQAASGRIQPITITVTVEQPRCHKESGWQAVGIRPVAADGVVISSIVGVTSLTLSRFMRVRVKGFIEIRFGKYQLNFAECEEVQAEYKNPILTILTRAGVPKVRGEIMQNDLGENFAQKVADDLSHIKRLFPKIKEAGTEAILTSCRKAAAGNEIFQALNSVGASQKAIDAAVAFDLETQSVYSLMDRGLQFARADALAQHPAIQALQPFNRHDHARIAHAALVQVKEYCGLWGHTGLPLADILSWLGLTYGLDPEICQEALILGAYKRGLHVDDGPNRHIFLQEHYEAECKIFRIVCALEGVQSKHGGKAVAPKSARIMAGSAEERLITFSPTEQCDPRLAGFRQPGAASRRFLDDHEK